MLQDALFTALKSKLQPSESLVDSVAAVLEVSTDSAYRRIRGDKELSLSELLKLSSRYNISLDHLSNNRLDAFCFTENWLTQKTSISKIICQASCSKLPTSPLSKAKNFST